MNDYLPLFTENHIEITPQQYEKLAQFVEMLTTENKRQNLTALHDKSEIWERHILDSAMILQFIPDHIHSVIDIGTGGGIPGIPLAILKPEVEVTLLDSELRKIEFCEEAIRALGLHAQAVCGRAEELGHTERFREQFDAAVSRAMAAGSMLCELAIPMLRVGGVLLGMKGRGYDPSAERFAESCEKLGAAVEKTEAYAVCGEQKYMIVCRKNCETPAQYPRRFAKIKRSPL